MYYEAGLRCLHGGEGFTYWTTAMGCRYMESTGRGRQETNLVGSGQSSALDGRWMDKLLAVRSG